MVAIPETYEYPFVWRSAKETARQRLTEKNVEYTTFGEAYAANTVETVQNRYGYTGREKSSVTGLNSHRYRFADPSLGRWTARDPIYYEDSVDQYEYVRSRPNYGIDPMGLFLWVQWLPKRFKWMDAKCCQWDDVDKRFARRKYVQFYTTVEKDYIKCTRRNTGQYVKNLGHCTLNCAGTCAVVSLYTGGAAYKACMGVCELGCVVVAEKAQNYEDCEGARDDALRIAEVNLIRPMLIKACKAWKR